MSERELAQLLPKYSPIWHHTIHMKEKVTVMRAFEKMQGLFMRKI